MLNNGSGVYFKRIDCLCLEFKICDVLGYNNRVYRFSGKSRNILSSHDFGPRA